MTGWITHVDLAAREGRTLVTLDQLLIVTSAAEPDGSGEADGNRVHPLAVLWERAPVH
ncbi:hypothetical protein [Pseudonocardia sp. H11422]|uniref:hypothetical protein n=1 Tax=Pseudonocardia sp. H11422 TaxID=2835866 RepID=UPI001BDC281F|nr:hypothetical protein [Pseudonocardia sp. H11422]